MPSDHEQDRALTYESYSELEMAATQWTPTEDLFHYTSAQAAAAMLTTGKLRLSPYPRTNDLWETEPHPPGLSGPQGEDLNATFAVWDELDRHLRLHTKVGCLTRDFVPAADITNRDAARGWSHLALWSHYGDKYGGVCLRVDQGRLIESFLRDSEQATFAFHGPVRYLNSQNGLFTGSHIDLGQVAEFGADAVALAYAEANKDLLFFRKHRDWSYESEYRLVVLNQSSDYDFIDIRDAVTGVILGNRFPSKDLRVIEAALEDYPDVEVQQLHYHQRRLSCVPFDFPPPAQPAFAQTPPARRDGSLAERLLALQNAETKAASNWQDAEALAHTPLKQLQAGISALESQLRLWPGVEVSSSPSTAGTVPEEMRARRPGVPGETIHYQRGFQCVVEHLPLHSLTFSASAAIQVLDGERLRLHALVAMEHWHEGGNDRKEVWRDQREVVASDALAAVIALLHALTTAADEARVAFDRVRGTSPEEPPGTELP
ncbi:hypothetical protein GCM10010222_11590 [Streptomyces tanashiensis]|uniref:DUF2971 domain-containing protein n=1 Tax=Streptomyces tanashiensis TaxID=67367 RepID=UPI00167299BB|nr:DUF2971 domain-containing protein [Streptomyces tanashiensis]GGS72468.1 hypothetical protein GCM10010222_11590 [Streptomyces tanashiensis]